MKTLLTSLLLLSAGLCRATITRVQTAKANSAAGTPTTLSAVFSSTPTAGNIVVLAASTSNNGGPVTIASNSGITWTYSEPEGSSGTVGFLAVGRVFSGASATVTITVSAGNCAMVMAEYSGSNLRIDRHVIATGNSAAPASGATSTTSSASQLWIGAIAHRFASGSTFSAPTNSFTIVDQDKSALGNANDKSVCLLERIVSSTGTPNAGATTSGSGVWVAQVMTIEEVTGGGGGSTEHSATFVQ